VEVEVVLGILEEMEDSMVEAVRVLDQLLVLVHKASSYSHTTSQKKQYS
jgi:hypothetical protein